MKKQSFKIKQFSKFQPHYYSKLRTKRLLMVAFTLTSFFSACSDDENCTSTEKKEVTTIYELGQCNAYRQSEIIFILNENAYYICNNNNWSKWMEINSSSSIFNSQEPYYSSAATPPVEVVNGRITDPRDGHDYRVTTIGTQIWMAENLNYETDNSLCLKNSIDSCTKYGRLYYFHNTTRKDPCPTGWHSASLNDWGKLFEYIGIPQEGDYQSQKDAILSLIAKGWINSNEGKSTDIYGFSVIPAGYSLIKSTSIIYTEGTARFWISTGDNCVRILFSDVYFSYIEGAQIRQNEPSCSDNEIIRTNGAYAGFSVRCVKD